MSDIVYCHLTSGNEIATPKPWRQGEDVEFMYMPAGTHTITAGFRGRAITMTVEIEPAETARVLQACFDGLVGDAPKQRPFGCVEHKEEDASVWAKGFVAREDGVYLAAEPSALGERNVNGRIHRSWSPSFTTDADYARAVATDGEYTFPEGVRGSAANPARITGVAFCVGTLTNKPAFKAINPVMAKDLVPTEPPQPEAGDCLRAGPLLALMSSVRLAHWNASTATNEHRALGGLYEALDEGVDRFVELYMGKRGAAACGDPPTPGLPELLDGGCAEVAELRKKMTPGCDDDLLNALADIDAALGRARYLLKEPDTAGAVLAHLTPVVTLDSVWARISPVNGQTGQPAA